VWPVSFLMHSPEEALHTRMVLSVDPLTTRSSGNTATVSTSCGPAPGEEEGPVRGDRAHPGVAGKDVGAGAAGSIPDPDGAVGRAAGHASVGEHRDGQHALHVSL
jgi:hypothetical protein